MDFPVCPSCGQSVIDDDVDDCPFCGASMKAKPGSKPAAKPAAQKPVQKPAQKPAVAASPKGAAPTRPAAGTRPGPADDFPFEAELPGARTAIQAMPNPSKGRTLEVVCPMCETTGYLPPTAAGKDVRCANAKCMVPIFKAPSAAGPVSEPVAPPKKRNLVLIGGITVAVMAAIGAAAVFLPGLLGPRQVKPSVSDEDRELIAELARQSAGKKPIPAAVTPDQPKVATTLPETKVDSGATPQSPDDFIAAALKQLNESSLKGEGRQQRSKAFCRQMAADACVRAGDLKAANEHLAQLVVVGPSVPYYRIEPNLEMFWNAWAANDKTTAARLLESALTDARKLPRVGRTRLELASRTAAALAVSGRINEGLELVERHQTDEADGQLSARIQMASDGRVSRLSSSRSVLPWTRPQAVAATVSLVVRGQPAAGRAWAEAQPDVEGRVECLAIWAEHLVVRQAKPGAASSIPEIVEAVKGLQPAQAARVWARAACGRFSAGDLDGAAATLKSAQDLLATIAVPAEPDMPAVKPAISYSLPAESPLVQAATAAAEIAYAHSLWPDHSPQAEQSLDQALAFARGLAPAWAAVSVKVNQAEQAGASGLREMIKKELALKSDDVANQNMLKYRKVLDDLADASQRRFKLQELIMSHLVKSGLKDKIWSVVSNRSAETNANRRDDFLGSPLIGALLVAFRGAETEKIILGAVSGGPPPKYPDAAVVDQLLQQSPQQAAQFASQSDARDLVALTAATRLATTDQGDVALGFIGRLDDIVLREEAYRLTAALLAQRGHAEQVWKQIAAVQQATEKSALCRGLVVGLKAGSAVTELRD